MSKRGKLPILIIVGLIFSAILSSTYQDAYGARILMQSTQAASTDSVVFIPCVQKQGSQPVPTPSSTAAPSATPTAPPSSTPTSTPSSTPPAPQTNNPKVNVPYTADLANINEHAIFWFGQVNPTNNYADGRIGYNEQEFGLRMAAFDRRVFYDRFPAPAELEAWDAFTLYLSLDAQGNDSPGVQEYMFVGQLNNGQERSAWQTSYQGDGSAWQPAGIQFSTTSSYRGNYPNDAIDDRGWTLYYHLPFASLGLTGAPPDGSVWRMAVVLHDRDDEAGTPISDQRWPDDMDPNRSSTWGSISFGLPGFTPPAVQPAGTTTIRQGLDGAQVIDAHVGGHTTCGGDFTSVGFFDGWGDANFAGYAQFNIQNQGDVSDWPCFSKYYITFPLDGIPPGKVILSATLRINQFSNSGKSGVVNPPQPSLIQVLTIQENWDESTITWNNAPYAVENISQAWAYPLDYVPEWPGVPVDWDVSRGVALTYAAGGPLRLVLYEADTAQHSGKYFSSSDGLNWIPEGRPTLTIIWGNP